jgi:HAD superfamily hydrolase (TIGR01484 family)
MSRSILLCTDLDRTLLPNGLQVESPEARPLFRSVAARPEVILAYVSGRSLALQHDAIRRWSLPTPDYAIADVGTTLYRIVDGRWDGIEAWREEIAVDWGDLRSHDLAALLGEPVPLRLQEPERQNEFKLSYYTPPDFDVAAFRQHMDERLDRHGLTQLRVVQIWSVDETRGQGLLDLLPERATKLHAVEFLIDMLGLETGDCMYSGDSGNDLAVLASEVPAVLVGNASAEVRQEAIRRAAEQRNEDALYLARGGLKGMNGNYAAGILEGMVHFMPETAAWL